MIFLKGVFFGPYFLVFNTNQRKLYLDTFHTVNKVLAMFHFLTSLTFQYLEFSTGISRTSKNQSKTLREECPNAEFFSGSYFPAFRLNTMRYCVSLLIEFESGKIRTRKNSVFGYFLQSEKLSKYKQQLSSEWSHKMYSGKHYLELQEQTPISEYLTPQVSKNCIGTQEIFTSM